MKRLAIVAALVVALAAGWWFGSPWWTLRQMRAAAEARDVAALSEHVDYPAVRESLKAQLRDRENSSSGILGALIGAGIADQIVDAAVTPEGLRLVFAAAPAAEPSAVRGESPPLGIRVSEMRMQRDSPGQFRMVPANGSGAELVFRLQGIGWKLVEVRIPERAPSVER